MSEEWATYNAGKKKKENRVFITTLKTEDIDEFCVYGRDCITRQEAIEKMAKAMCHSPSGTCEDCFARESKKACKQAMFGMKKLAEAALDELLKNA